MVIIKNYKVKKLYNKFPERLEYISGNFPREISELTTLVTSLHSLSQSAEWNVSEGSA